MLDFAKYDLYKGYKDFSNKLKEKSELQDKSRLYTLTLKKAGGEIIDRVTLTSEEYRLWRNKYSTYQVSHSTDSDIMKQIKDIDEYIYKLRDEFNKTIKDVLFEDIAKELNITNEQVKTILRVTLNRANILLNSFSNNDYIDTEENIAFYTYESLMNDSMNDTYAEKIFTLVENEVNLLRMKI